MTSKVHLSTWKSTAAEQRFRSMEDELVRDLVAERPTALDVHTRLGPTRAYHWEGTGEPTVFLHGATGTSLMWAPLAQLRAGRAMYAIDTIGEVGRSQQLVAVEGAEDLADWLAETLAGLGLDRAHLAATSYGGFLALNLAVRRPALVRSLFLIEPAGVERVRMLRFMMWGLSVLFSSWLPTPLRTAAAARLRTPALSDPRVFRLVLFGQRNHRARLLRPEPFSDEELRSIRQPVQLILGAKSEVFRSAAVRTRAEANLPHATVEVIKDGGHAIVTTHTELVADRLFGFVD
jgi:pimeloyl-ACP methyl ester carboxylesterase